MSKMYISNNLGKRVNRPAVAGYRGGRICRFSCVEGSRRRVRTKDDKVIISHIKTPSRGQNLRNTA